MNGPAALPTSSTAPDGSPASSAAAAGAGTASAAALMRSLSVGGGDRAERRLHIHFRVVHDTKWGEHVVLLGSGGCGDGN
jgi:hypothetical protein